MATAAPNQTNILTRHDPRPYEVLLKTGLAGRNQPLRSDWSEIIGTSSEQAQMPVLQWAELTVSQVFQLPYNRDGWQEGSVRTSTAAATDLLLILGWALNADSPAPRIGPVWDGGVQAEWHRNGVDLGIVVSSGGKVFWSFIDLTTGQEVEREFDGRVTEMTEQETEAYVRQLEDIRSFVHRVGVVEG